MDTIVITTEGGTGDAADTVIVTQEAVPTIMVTSSDEITIDYDITAAQTIEFNVGGSATGWRVTSNHDSITLSPTSGSSGTGQEVMATFTENRDVLRTATITITTVGQLGASVTAEVTITQTGALNSPTLSVTPPSGDTTVAYTATTISDSVEIMFTTANATGWESMISYGVGVGEFVTLSPMDSATQAGEVTIKAAVTKNVGVERSATITLSTTGQIGFSAATREITIVQRGAPPMITESGDTTIAYDVTATDTLDVITFEVGGGATGWEAKVIDGDKFLTLVDSKGGADTGTIRVTADENTGEAPRMDTIVITTEGGTGEAATDTVIVTQEAVPTIKVTDPSDGMVTINHDVTDAQTIMFNVGGSATGWTASSDQDFVKLDTMGSSGKGIEVTATPMANTETTARTATVTITTTGQLGASVTAEVTITQSAAPIISVDPHTLMLTSGNTVDVANTATVSTDSIEIRFVVGGEATGWMAAVDADFVTLGKTMGSSGSATLKAAVTANTGIERTAIITLTTTGSTGTAVDTTIMIKQAAGSSTLLLISDSSVAVANTATTSLDSIAIMFTVGGGATGWEATVDSDFVTLGKTMGSSGSATLKAAVTENTGAARTAKITLMTIDGTGTADTVVITQAASVVVTPVLRVRTDGDSLADGSSWANAMTLKAALMASTTAGDQIWITAGTYMPHEDDRTATFTIPEGVLVYGGFAGDENTFTPDDPLTPANEDTRLRNAEGVLTNVTILSGDLMRDDGTRPVQPAEGEDMTAYNAARAAYDATRDDNSYTVVTIAGENVTLDGLTITAGADGNQGAGLYVGDGTAGITLTGCTFNNNSADNFGGGAYFREAATLTGCDFTGNTAGGGFGQSGGGASFYGTATLTGCTFTGNEARSGSGGASFFGTATLTACTFAGNKSSQFGGGANFYRTATLTACTFTGNESQQGGGAIFYGTATLTNCVVVGNTATITCGGLLIHSEGTVINSTLYNNTAPTGRGGGILVTGSPFTLQNSILIGNTAATGNQVYVDNGDADDPFPEDNFIGTLQTNLIEGGADPMGTDQGILYGTPGFCEHYADRHVG